MREGKYLQVEAGMYSQDGISCYRDAYRLICDKWIFDPTCNMATSNVSHRVCNQVLVKNLRLIKNNNYPNIGRKEQSG